MIKRAAALFIVLATGACSSTPTPEAGELLVTPLGGSVSLVDGSERTLLEEATTIDAGVSIVTELGGRAQVDLPGERSMELAPETELRVDDEMSEVADGSVLVRTSSPITLRAGGADIQASDGIFRIDAPPSTSVLLATYSGAATVVGSGVPPITALRQAEVLPGGDTLGMHALEVRRNHPWDAELLGQAIDLGLQLREYERGLTRQLPSSREAEAVSRVLQRGFSSSSIRSAIADLGNAAKAVVAAVVAQEASRLAGGSASSILAEIVDLIRILGANWIVVVAEWGLPAAAAALAEKLGEFADSITQVVAPAAAPTLLATSSQSGVTPQGQGQGQDQPGPTDQQGGGGPGRDEDPTPPPGGGSGSTTEVAPPPPPPPPAQEQPPPNPKSECANTVDCTVEDIIDDPPRSDPLLPI